MKKSDCFSCHQVDRDNLGPGYKSLAHDYGSKPGIEDQWVQEIREGMPAGWGPQPMPAHPGLKDADLHTMVRWVLAQ
jgi:cytochrome c